MQFRIPVNQTIAAIDQTLVIEADKHFFHGRRQPFVHGEAFTCPVDGTTQAADLLRDDAAGLFFPLPDFIKKLVATQLSAFDTLAFQTTFDHHLGGNACVVGTHLPEGVAPHHAVVTDQCIHDGILETVTHVQATCDVRGRYHNTVGVAFAAGGKVVTRFPGLVPLLFDVLGLVGLVHGCSGGLCDGSMSESPGLYLMQCHICSDHPVCCNPY